MNKIEKFDIMEPERKPQGTTENNETKEKENGEAKNKKKCKFPTAYSMLLIIELIVFILTFIIPKGKFATISFEEYDNGTNYFKVIYPNNTDKSYPANKTILEHFKIIIPIESFEKGYIKKPVSIPNTYEKIKGEKTQFFKLFTYPIAGMIESADILFFLMILGGTLGVLVEMNALTNGLYALARILKGRGFLLFCIIMILISIGGTTFGMAEETLAFYPILMPIFLRSGLDGLLGTIALFSGSLVGTMFSTVNAFAVVIASYSAGIPFTEGIVFRVIGLVIGDLFTIAYCYFYYRRISADETRSICYSIKKDLEDKFLKDKEEEKKDNNIPINDEEASLKSENKTKKDDKKNEFTLIQKIALLFFILGFVIMIIGVSVLGWWFDQMTAVFLVLAIILMIFSCQSEEEAIKYFMKGLGDFASISLAIGLARGVNITLDDGKISDTILYGLSKTLGNVNKVVFGIIMLFIFIILGFFIQSSSGLAVLSMPIFAPLADKVQCPRTLVVNAYMFAQNLDGFIAPTGLLLIVLQIVGIPFNHWIKFIWPFVILLFVLIFILILINTAM